MEIGSIICLVVQLPLCSAVFKDLQTQFFEPLGTHQKQSILLEFVKITAHIEILCGDIEQLRRGA